MISSPANPLIKRVRRLQKRSERERAGRFLVEGARAVEAAARAARVERAFYTPAGERRRPALIAMLRDVAQEAREVAPPVMVAMTSRSTAPDVLAVCRVDSTLAGPPGALDVVLTDVHDPATAGSIAAAAAAVGAGRVVFAEGAVDPYDPKTVRSAGGAHFVLPVTRGGSVAALVGDATAAGRTVVAFADRGSAPWEVDLRGPVTIVVAESPVAGPVTPIAIPQGVIGAQLAQRAAVVLYEWVRQQDRGI